MCTRSTVVLGRRSRRFGVTAQSSRRISGVAAWGPTGAKVDVAKPAECPWASGAGGGRSRMGGVSGPVGCDPTQCSRRKVRRTCEVRIGGRAQIRISGPGLNREAAWNSVKGTRAASI